MRFCKEAGHLLRDDSVSRQNFTEPPPLDLLLSEGSVEDALADEVELPEALSKPLVIEATLGIERGIHQELQHGLGDFEIQPEEFSKALARCKGLIVHQELLKLFKPENTCTDQFLSQGLLLKRAWIVLLDARGWLQIAVDQLRFLKAVLDPGIVLKEGKQVGWLDAEGAEVLLNQLLHKGDFGGWADHLKRQTVALAVGDQFHLVALGG